MPIPKRRRLLSDDELTVASSHNHRSIDNNHDQLQQDQSLLPGLPDHLAQLCLARVPPSLLAAVCYRWRSLLYSPTFPPFLSLYAVLEPIDSNNNNKPSSGPIEFFSYDPIAGKWSPLPPPPPPSNSEEESSGGLRRLLRRHPSFIARFLPIQTVSTTHHLVVVAGSSPDLRPALRCPAVFSPASKAWIHAAPKMLNPRRWCACGPMDRGRLFIACGVGEEYSADVAKSVNVWDPFSDGGRTWKTAAELRDGSRFSLEPVDAVYSNGKVCLASSAKHGAVYEPEPDEWVEMPVGLKTGWTGPASAYDGGPIYAVDSVKGELKEYGWESDAWTVVRESERLKGTVQIAAGKGKVCAAADGGTAVVVVEVEVGDKRKREKRRMWIVEPPEGKKVISLHVLPRMPADE